MFLFEFKVKVVSNLVRQLNRESEHKDNGLMLTNLRNTKRHTETEVIYDLEVSKSSYTESLFNTRNSA